MEMALNFEIMNFLAVETYISMNYTQIDVELMQNEEW
jgi:hypothetical protein